MEEVGEEVIELRGKESNHPMFMSANDWKESSPQVSSDALVVSRSLSKRSIVESPKIDPSNDMVEELTFKVRDSSNVCVVGNSNGSVKEAMPSSRLGQGHWKHLYQLAGGLGNGSSNGGNVSKGKEQETALLVHTPQQQSNQQSVDMSRQFFNNENDFESPSAIRTKNLSSSGFHQFISKNSLKGKSVAHRYIENRDGFGVTGMRKTILKDASVGREVFEASQESPVRVDPHVCTDGPVSVMDGICLREWLKPGRKVDRGENMHIFKQIVELVDIAHSQQVALKHVRPSCFKLLPLNLVKYVGSFVETEVIGNTIDMDVSTMVHHSGYKRLIKEGLPHSTSISSKQQKLQPNVHVAKRPCHSSEGSGYKQGAVKEVADNNTGERDSGCLTTQYNLDSEHGVQKKSSISTMSNAAQNQFTIANFQLEDKWYTSPEEYSKREQTLMSDIYCLGVLLFELFYFHESWEVHTRAMLDIRHRILPPNFLSEYPKEAGFCLWLLHPDPWSRPGVREILQSELLSQCREVSEDQPLLTVEEDHTESEILLHFLLSSKELKHKRGSKVAKDIGGIEADIKEVERRYCLRNTEVNSLMHKDHSDTKEFILKEPAPSQHRLVKNMNQLESAYFSVRSQIQVSETHGAGRSDTDLLNNRESWSQGHNENVSNPKPTDHLGAFFEGLCKYARYNKFEVRGTLRNADLLNSPNVICSLSFDRDEQYFAAAGVSKKIKIFEFNALLNDSVDIHYPAVEMTSKSKLSCVCWNGYVKNYLAATDYDGVVQLWDASTGQCFSQYTDHEKRAWSVDFSPVDPTKLASGSDDCTVKLWNINERKCSSTIRSYANVCCVQFSSESSHLLAFGSADFKTYCYDLRNTRTPWCILSGHEKAVSYVKFLDSETIISASTDNTLKLWDLTKTNSTGLSTNACTLTFKGHTNEKNFVGLSVSDGYIACGSESNEVYAYHRSLPMPMASHKFGCIDPVSGQENGDDNGQFVSSVCWKGKSNMLLAANSTGSIKLLQTV